MNKYMNRLIANDIIDYGITNTLGFNYVIYMDNYLSKSDNKAKEYILNNLDDISNEISKNDKVTDFYFDKKNQSFDLVFYIDSVLDRVEKCVYQEAERVDKKLELDDVKKISTWILDDDEFWDDLTNKVQNYGKEYNL